MTADRSTSPPPPPPPLPPSGRVAQSRPAKKDPAHRTPWRDNLEAAAMAILLALFLKAFLVEAYKIPSGSMQPTLMGMPTPGDALVARNGGPPPTVKDRILVDKLTPRLRDPERWEVLIFRYPLDRTQNFVKRLVGMPSEELRIANGDIFVRSSPAEPWRIPRRPERVQEAHWREVTPITPRPWQQTQGSGWLVEEDAIVATGDGAARFGDGSPILDLYFDGYPESIRAALPIRHRNEAGHRVGDLRLSGALRPKSDCRTIRFVLTEGLRRYQFLLPGPAADPDARASIDVEPSAIAGASLGRTVSDSAGPLRAERRVAFEVENLDDRVTLRLDGREVASLDVEPSADQQATVTLAVEGGEVAFDDLELARDIFYFATGRSEYSIPAEHYLMLGDNTLNSSDGREWTAARFAPLEAPEEVLVGNQRNGDNPTQPVLYGGLGPIFGFTDEWGNEHLLQLESRAAGETAPDWLTRVVELAPEPAPFVPRELIVGRALAVFWPILPHQGIVRLEWVD